MKWQMLMATLVSSLGLGCAATNRPTTPYDLPGYVSDDPQAPSRSVLFDAALDAPPADWFAYRSDWPSAPRDVSTGEVTSYDVYFIDREQARDGNGGGHGSAQNNYTYRTFRSIRSGRTYR